MDSWNYERMYVCHLETTLVEIKTDIRRKHGVNLSYYRSWKGNELVLKEEHGNWKKAYSLPRSYLVQLLNVDPAAQACLVRKAEKSYLRLSVRLDVVYIVNESFEKGHMRGRNPSNGEIIFP